MGEEKLSPLHGDEGSIGSYAGGDITTGFGKRLLQLGDNRIVLRQKFLLMKRTNQSHHRPGEKVVRLKA